MMISMHLVHVQASNTHIHATIVQQATQQQQSDTACKAHTPGPPCRRITRALASRKSTPSCRTRRCSAQGQRPRRAAAPAREVTVHCHPAPCRAAPSALAASPTQPQPRASARARRPAPLRCTPRGARLARAHATLPRRTTPSPPQTSLPPPLFPQSRT
jgi:hypothetical protein